MSEQRTAARIIARSSDGTEVDITDEVRAVYDVAARSVDLDGGLFTGEAAQLRRVQAALGADPLQYGGDPCEECTHRRENHYGTVDAGGCYEQCPCAGFTFGGKRQTLWGS